MDTPHTVGNRFLQARVLSKLSQKQVALALGATRQMVSAWERGIATPSLRHLTQVCGLYHCSCGWLLSGEVGAPTPPRAGSASAAPIDGMGLMYLIFGNTGVADPYPLAPTAGRA